MNRTSRMCAKGEENKINISLETYNLIKHAPYYRFVEREIEAKGIGKIPAYFVFKKRGMQESRPFGGDCKSAIC